MGWVDWTIGIGIFLFVMVFSYTSFMRSAGVRGGIEEIYEIKSEVFNYFQKLLNSFGSPPDWTSANWDELGLIANLRRIPIEVEENAGIGRTSEVIDIHLIFDEDCERAAFSRTFRLMRNNAEVPFDLYNETYCYGNFLKEANLVFFANISANSSELYHLYFSSDQSVEAVNYASDLIYSNYLQNSKLKLNLTGEISEIYNLQTSSSNILSGRKLGIMQFNATSGLLYQTNDTGTKNLLINSSFIKKVQISGTNPWFDYKMNVTLYAYQPYFTLKTWVREKLSIALHDFRNPEADLAGIYGSVGYRNDTGNYTSTASIGNVNNTYYIASFNSSAAQDSLALLTTNHSTWSSAGWNNSGSDFSFSHIANEYDNNTISIQEGQEFLTNEVFVFPFKSTDIGQVEDFWKKISNPLQVTDHPIETMKVLSASKLLELEKINYTEAVKSLGGYDFSIEIRGEP